MYAKEAIGALVSGNQRFVEGRSRNPNRFSDRRNKLAQGQEPVACILGCADSRVAPEIIFDQGLGDLFVLRVAGNLVNDMIVGSLEYAVAYLGVQLIVVLGHQRCGAVTAAVQGGTAPGKIESLVKAIRPAVEQAADRPGDKVDNAVRENIKRGVVQLKAAAPILAPKFREGILRIEGAFYHLDSGTVEFLG